MGLIRLMVTAVLLVIATVGCSSSASKLSNGWIADHGGMLEAGGDNQARLDITSKQLVTACRGRAITVRVLATDEVGAFSFRDGRIFVTRGLMDRLTDSELQAVVAHELGHLLSDGRLQTVAALNGSCCANADCEIRADAVGARLLQSRGLSPTAMISMLQQLQQIGSLSPAGAEAVRHRADVLSAALEQAGQPDHSHR